MNSERGGSLVLVLIILLFLSIIGGALITSSTIDAWVADNFKTNVQLLYAAESALERAREDIRVAAGSPSERLRAAAGADGAIQDSNDPDVLLASDDQPVYPGGPGGPGGPGSADLGVRAAGESLIDASGREIGRYWVWLQNDAAEGVATTSDANEVLNFVGFARIGKGRKTIEMTVRKGRFPPVPAALTLNGPVALFGVPASGRFQVIGSGGNGFEKRYAAAIGVIDTGSMDVVTSAIPPGRASTASGSSGEAPAIENVEAEMDALLKSPAHMEHIVSSIARSATEIYSPAFGSAETIRNYGSPDDYKVAIVNGDCELGPGTGYGLLVVRGNLKVVGAFNWFGQILVVGQGVLHWTGNGEVRGGILVARTRGAPSQGEVLGQVLTSRGSVVADFSRAGSSGIEYSAAQIASANRRFPYSPIAIWER